MKSMILSDFKARCIAVLKEVQRSGEPIVVTRRGKPLARVEPQKPANEGKQLGALEGTLRVQCDLVHSDTTADWDA